MPPNLEGQFSEEEIPYKDDEYSLVLATIIPVPDIQQNITVNIQHPDEDEIIFLPEELHLIPLDQNLRELLIRVTNTEELSTVTHVKLRVISREVTLQYLSVYTPALRELTLDGSVIFSLRDLGDGLKNLKILRVNRCGLTNIDGAFGFEKLEELYIASNVITNMMPCVFLANIRILDLRNNYLNENEVSYLGLCPKLEELFIAGNYNINDLHDHRNKVALSIPSLKILDGVPLGADASDGYDDPARHNLHGNFDGSSGFSINFPPRVYF